MHKRPAGLINFRDFGGYATADGGMIRRDRLYRCGHLAELSDAELEHVIGLDFAVIADLRYAGERDVDRSPWPEAYLDRIVAHDGHRTEEAPHMDILAAGSAGTEGVDRFYDAFYSELPFDPLYQPLFARTIARIAEADGRALIHCAAGKDRTGIQSALILHVLGAPRATIVADYMRSSKAPGLMALKARVVERFEARVDVRLSDEAADALLDVKPGYIETMFAAVEARYGSVEGYLDASGADEAVRARLRSRLVED